MIGVNFLEFLYSEYPLLFVDSIEPFEIICNTISLVTSIRRLTKTENDSERMFTKCENIVSLYHVLHVAHDA